MFVKISKGGKECTIAGNSFNSLQGASWKLKRSLHCPWEGILHGTVLGRELLTTCQICAQVTNSIKTPNILISQPNYSQMPSKLIPSLVWEKENVLIILAIKILPRHKDYYYFFFCKDYYYIFLSSLFNAKEH